MILPSTNEDRNDIERILTVIDDYEVRFRQSRLGGTRPYHQSELRSIHRALYNSRGEYNRL